VIMASANDGSKPVAGKSAKKKKKFLVF